MGRHAPRGVFILAATAAAILGFAVVAPAAAVNADHCITAGAVGDPIPPGPPAVPPSAGAGLRSVRPVRLVDTRVGRELGAGRQVEVDVSGYAGAGSTAVAVNLTVAAPCASGFVTAYPCGGSNPLASNLNMVAGQTVAAHAIVALTPGRRSFCVMSSRQTDLIVDLMGVYQPGDPPLAAAAPVRILDTRDAGRRLAAGSTATVNVSGRQVTAVLNVTTTDALADGYLTVYPANESSGSCETASRPLASVLNPAVGATVANLVQVDAPSSVCVFSSVATHVIIDDIGSYSIGGSEFLHVFAPFRLVDTRSTGTPITGGTVLAVSTLPRAGAGAAAVTITAVGAAGPGYVTAFPPDAAGTCNATDRPLASTLNVAGPDPVANAAIVSTGGGSTLCVFAQTTTHLIVDQVGTFNESP